MDISTVRVIDHPLMHLFTTELRNQHTPPHRMRGLVRQICTLMMPELTADVAVIPVRSDGGDSIERWELQTPVSVIGIMRTGLILMDSFLEFFPEAQAVHLGISPARDGMGVLPYYESIPSNFANRDVILLDSAISSGNTLLYALETIMPYELNSVTVGVIVADPTGITRIQERFPTVRFVVAVADKKGDKPLLPKDNFGVFADRLYGTS